MCSSLSFPRIDVHTHILPPHWPDLHRRYGYGSWVRLEPCQDEGGQCGARMYQGDKFFRQVKANCFDPRSRLIDCDNDGVQVQVLSTVPVMFSYWAKAEDTLDLSIMLNDHIAAVVSEHPGRFLGLATLPMQSPDLAIQELHRCMTEKGFIGIQIGSHVNQLPLSDPSFFPIFEACVELDACVFIHPWDMPGGELMSKYWLPWLVGMPAETSFGICSLIFSGILEKLPTLRVCFAHGGGSFPGTIGRIEHGFHCRPDLVAVDNPHPPSHYLGKFYVDSLVHNQHTLQEIVQLFTEEKVVCGSDYPFPLGEEHPGQMVEQSTTLTEKQKHKILWDNAVSFVGSQKIDKLLHAIHREKQDDQEHKSKQPDHLHNAT